MYEPAIEGASTTRPGTGERDPHVKSAVRVFESALMNGKEFVERFYENLFNQHPDVKLLFEERNLTMTQREVLDALTLVVRGLHDPAAIEPVLRRIGDRHVTYGVRPSYLALFQSSIMKTLPEFAGDSWTPESARACSDALTHVVTTMGGAMDVQPTPSAPAEPTDAVPAKTAPVKVTPAAAAPLDEAGIQLVQDHVNTLAARGDELVTLFYENLFTAQPELQKLFDSSAMPLMRQQVFHGLTLAVQGLRQPEAIGAMLRKMGARHLGYGVIPGDLDGFSSTMLITLAEFDPHVWNDQLEASWSAALGTVIALMQDGMAHRTPAVVDTGAALPQGSGQLLAGRLSPAGRADDAPPRPPWHERALTAFIEAPPKVITPLAIVLIIALFFGARASTLIGEMIGKASAIAFVLGLFIWVREIPGRRKQAVFNAFQTVDASRGATTSPARISALEQLARERVSLRGLDLAGMSLLRIQAPEVDLTAASLSGTDLRGANLTGANLLEADLRDAKLGHSHLGRARLSFAKLCGADLTLADLAGADLTCADLAGTCLAGANLEGAVLAGTSIERASFAGANLRSADLTGLDLSIADIRGAILPDGTLPSSV